ncbi:Na(+)-translocating NADH-quinone reductase subunit A [Dokdonia pacifica]|uniref:Na(+)-translocating NADH-quinone reductase subunit A n=1 Tax=Dokdonia pacifica TaxID=1627892 RepID=A0A239A4N5_9FLAO|nr:Na(+)-translocating NADH-quinone reductase subunit A [Dokdonia pacifica]GGG34992.1 Na(+)-translocating NADH-quinone reductase subunit A [Dokdonia pacifica]SNR90617.1 Na+-transporting NADH:ubiquinone oxidoreductase subunit A [Dokdonia pacifica]
MSKDIRIKKGLDIRLVGEAEKSISEGPRSRTITIRPSDFHLVTPKMVVKEGAKLQVGDELFFSKSQEQIRFVSPVAGTLVEIKRGARRVITDLVIEADYSGGSRDFGKLSASASPEAIKEKLLSNGLWPFIKQRPYDVIANPANEPKAIFISGHNTAPLAPDLDFVLSGKEAALQAALTALNALTSGGVHISVGSSNAIFSGMNHVVTHTVKGPHPAGNVGTLINKLNPVNKGETVWTVAAQDLVIIGELLLTGTFNATRIISVAGSGVKKPSYYKTIIGAEVSTFAYDAGVDGDTNRFISGNVLTGNQIKPDGALGYYANEFVAIPEGDDYEFFGWNKPVFNKISPSRALTFSWMQPKKKYDLDTNTNGEHRAFVVTGNYEEVFPLDIYPLQILKACMVNDLDEMEALGMYEVAPEDFALTEFICVSKQPHQDIIRKGLDLMYNEIG